MKKDIAQFDAPSFSHSKNDAAQNQGGAPRFSRDAGQDPRTPATMQDSDPKATIKELVGVAKLNITIERYFGNTEHVYRTDSQWGGDSARHVQEAFRAAFGTSIVYVKPEPGSRDTFNGFIDPAQPKTLFVNTDADVGFIQISEHEL